MICSIGCSEIVLTNLVIVASPKDDLPFPLNGFLKAHSDQGPVHIPRTYTFHMGHKAYSISGKTCSLS